MTTLFDAQKFVGDFARSMNAKEPETLLRYYADNAELWDPSYPAPIRGKAAIRESIEKWSAAFSELKMNVKDIIQSGNKVAITMEVTARNTGEMEAGPGETFPVTNKTATLQVAEILTIENGKITRDYTYFDVMGMLVQLGLAPGAELASGTPQHAGSPKLGR